jgi:hypothetical protein
MKNKKDIIPLICQGMIAGFLVANIAIAFITKQANLFSYICCHILGILQSITIISIYIEENKR